MRAHSETHKLLQKVRLTRIIEKDNTVQKWCEKLERETTTGGTWGDVIRKSNPDDIFSIRLEFNDLHISILEEILYRIRYKGYLEREIRHIDKMSQTEHVRIPSNFEYESITGLRNESQQKLIEIRPATLGQAARISGVSPADVAVLMVMLKAKNI